MSKYSKYSSNLTSVMKDIDKISDDRVRKAGRYVAKVIRKNISGTGKSHPGGFPSKFSGKYKRSIASSFDRREKVSAAGSKSGISHLLEYGHGDGKQKNKRPHVFPSFVEATPEVGRILSERYW